MIKEILKNAALIILGFTSIFILCLGIVLPLFFGSKDFPTWLPWVVYPLAVLIMASAPLIDKNYSN